MTLLQIFIFNNKYASSNVASVYIILVLKSKKMKERELINNFYSIVNKINFL
jgi:hypothetical protein